MNIYMIGCLHFSHESMAKHRGFDSAEEHDNYLISQWNKTVKSSKDIVYILGDITMEKATPYYKLDMLNGVKHVVLGNHDKRQHVPELLIYVDTVGGAIDFKECLLTHVPIHPNEVMFYRKNIHAHIHHVNKLEECIVNQSYTDNSLTSKTKHKYFNVDAKLLDFTPILFNDIVSETLM